MKERENVGISFTFLISSEPVLDGIVSGSLVRNFVQLLSPLIFDQQRGLIPKFFDL